MRNCTDTDINLLAFVFEYKCINLTFFLVFKYNKLKKKKK